MTMIETYRLFDSLTDRYTATLRAKFVGRESYDLLISEADADVYKPDGTLLLSYRRGAIPADFCAAALPALRRAARLTLNRGDAAGGDRQPQWKKDGTLSRTTYAAPVSSGIIGYFDRTARQPYCRTTTFTRRDRIGWRSILPFVRAVNAVYERECPERFRAQLAVARRTPRERVIPGTVFTTATVNRNFPTAVHKDKGDLPEGFGVMSVIRRGEYTGGELVFPKFRVAVDLKDRDVLLADVHEYHGNTRIDYDSPDAERISTVLYFRTGMQFCLDPAQELARVRSRGPGDRLSD
jgi:hypothetical protein